MFRIVGTLAQYVVLSIIVMYMSQLVIEDVDKRVHKLATKKYIWQK